MSANLITFDAQYMNSQADNLSRAASAVSEAVNSLRRASAHENWRCRECNVINDKLGEITSFLGRLNGGMEETAHVLKDGANRFTELENIAASQADNIAGDLKDKHGFNGSSYSYNSNDSSADGNNIINNNVKLPVTKVPYDQNGINIAKTGLTFLDKLEVSDKAGTGKDIISYVQALEKFVNGERKGLSGASDFCNLTDKSIGVGSAIYEYLKDKDLFHARLGIAGNVFGLASSGFEIANTINTEKLGPAGVAGEILGAGSDVVDLWGSIEKYRHVADTATNITTKAGATGLYSPLSFYTAIGKGYFDAFAQGAKDIEKYFADGKWDLADTARTGIDFGITGLYGMADSLSFGALSTFGKVTGFTPENISRDIANWSTNLGKDARKYINNNKVLSEVYQHVGPIGKAAITFHAAHQSLVKNAFNDVANFFKSLFS